MRLLADENFPRPIIEHLRSQGHDVVWARTDCPALPDRALLERAESEGRVILTLDKDFWQLALQRPVLIKRGGVILFRVHPATTSALQRVMDLTPLAEHSWEGHVSIVTRQGIEMIATGPR